MNTIKINVQGKTTVPLESLEPFQGDLKQLSKEEYEKFRKVLIQDGFSFCVHIWQNKKKNYIIDGHQRVFVLKQLRETEGFKIPAIPVSVIKAPSFKAAKLRVLSGASQYGRITQSGLHQFMTENEIAFDDIVASFNFSEIDFGDFSQTYLGLTGDKIAPGGDQPSGGGMQSGSDQVKQIQLYFNAEAHAEFVEKVESLAAKFKTENISDTLMECVREIHKAKAKLLK